MAGWALPGPSALLSRGSESPGHIPSRAPAPGGALSALDFEVHVRYTTPQPTASLGPFMCNSSGQFFPGFVPEVAPWQRPDSRRAKPGGNKSMCLLVTLDQAGAPLVSTDWLPEALTCCW